MGVLLRFITPADNEIEMLEDWSFNCDAVPELGVLLTLHVRDRFSHAEPLMTVATEICGMLKARLTYLSFPQELTRKGVVY